MKLTRDNLKSITMGIKGAFVALDRPNWKLVAALVATVLFAVVVKL